MAKPSNKTTEESAGVLLAVIGAEFPATEAVCRSGVADQPPILQVSLERVSTDFREDTVTARSRGEGECRAAVRASADVVEVTIRETGGRTHTAMVAYPDCSRRDLPLDAGSVDVLTGDGDLPVAATAGVGASRVRAARAFADRHGVEGTQDWYHEVVVSEDFDVLQVATTNEAHKVNTMTVIDAGKPVLCEKPLGINAHQVEEIVELSTPNQASVMEAMWMRFLLFADVVKEQASSGAIDEFLHMEGSLSCPVPLDHRGAGSTLDRVTPDSVGMSDRQPRRVGGALSCGGAPPG